MERLIIRGCQGESERFFVARNREITGVKQEVKTGANRGGIDIKQGVEKC